jgi:hypothetical protein
LSGGFAVPDPGPAGNSSDRSDEIARVTTTDPTPLDRVRDGIYAADLLTVAIAELDLFSHVLHDRGEEQVRALLAASFAALPAGGRFVDHDTHIDARKGGRLPVAEYSVLLMHSTPGRCWSTAELAAMLADAGFRDTEVRPTAADRTVIVARKYG